MRKISILLILLCIIFSANAQSVDYKKVILPEDAPELTFEEKLVRLAWKNYPTNEVFQRNINIAEKNLMLSKWSWTDNFRVFYNLNDRTLQGGGVDNGTGTGGSSYGGLPMYGLGMSFNLGSFISVPGRVKIARENVKISEADLNTQKLTIRAEMLKRYRAYLLSLEILKMRAQAVEDAHSNFLAVSQRFRNGEATMEDYNSMSQFYSKALESKLVAENDLSNAKIMIEEMIGIRLEEVQ
jgi:outer membrane protein TolC